MSKISDKINKLINAGFALGASLDTKEVTTGSGGFYQRFQNATLFWHSVMGKEAHEVHGGILKKYLGMGGPGVNPATGRRDLGFPLSDEIRTEDGLYPVSYFEWGAIFWKQGGLALTGDFYTCWKNQKDPYGLSGLGYPVSETIAVAGGELVFFEYGCLYKGIHWEKGVNKIRFTFPQMGLPCMIHPDTGEGLKKYRTLRMTVNKQAIQTGAPDFFQKIFNNRLFLIEVGAKNAAPAALDFSDKDFVMTDKVLEAGQGDPIPMTDPNWPVIDKENWHIVSPVTLASGVKLKDRTLYDLCVKLPSGEFHPLSRHCVYAKREWDNFGIVHATDLHVSRRLDGFRKKMKEKGMDEAAKNFNNYNDNFRDFIRYANALHAAGKLDVIMMTGDLVDYGFEVADTVDDLAGYLYNNAPPNAYPGYPGAQKLAENFLKKQKLFLSDVSDNTLAGGNFAFFEKLILGQIPSPEGVKNEELKVPILTSLGNHDYRHNPYGLFFDISITGIDDPTIRNFWPHNLTEEETKKLLGAKPTIETGPAEKMVEPDEENKKGRLNFYLKNINRNLSYRVELGKNRIVMIDGKWDVGIVEAGWWTAVESITGTFEEDEKNFLDGSPDSKGFTESEISLLKNALNTKDGLVIVGTHAPPYNPKGNEYSHFLRETEHRLLDKPLPVVQYLMRRDQDAFAWRYNTNSWDAYRIVHLDADKHQAWSRRIDSYFYCKNNVGDLLDYGTATERVDEFLRLCCGVEAKRPADLVLCGHVHKNWESRLFWDGKAFQIFTDFYTENPENYYHTGQIGINENGRISEKEFQEKMEPRKIHISVHPQVKKDEPVLRDYSNKDYPKGILSLRIPANPLSLDQSSRKKNWWENHRPLVIQTAGLGPMENQRLEKDEEKDEYNEPQPNFQGCRVIVVKNNVIEAVNYRKMDEMRKALRLNSAAVTLST